MTFNALNAKFASFIPIDKIIGTYTGSFVSPAPTSGGGTTTTTFPITTNIPTSTFFQGIYSIDNGVTWNDFCNNQLVLPPGIFFPFFSVIGKSTANTMTIKAINNYNYNTSSSSSYTVLFKVALIARPDQGIITPQPIGTNTFFNSKYNYQKILSDTINNITISSGSQSFTIPHNLGYIPKIRPFIFSNIDSSMNEAVNSFLGRPDIKIDTNNVYFTFNAPFTGWTTGKLYMRIYYDN